MTRQLGGWNYIACAALYRRAAMVLGNGTWGWGTVWTVPIEPLKLLETFRRALASANRARPLLRSVSGL